MLNPKQKRFCEEYILDLNATQAYIRAGYSERSADKLSTRMMGYDGIKEYIAFLQRERAERTKVTLDSVVFRIDDIANDTEEDNTKLKALDMLMKHLGGYIADKEVINNEVEVIENF